MHLADSLATLRLDPTLELPLFRQLYEAVKRAILDASLAPGTRLPPTRELADLLRVSRQTVLNAYAQLTAEGYLSGSVGRGTFVSSELPGRARPPSASNALLRPLSARGAAHTGPAVALNIHPDGLPRTFRIGMPGLDVFPFEVWARLEARCWRRPHHLGYGDPAGYLPLRTAIATYLRAARGVRCEAGQVVITSGSQQALYLIATLLLDPGDAAWVEEPGYRGISACLHAAQAHICPVPVDADGLDVAYGARRHPHARLVYVTPSHQLPLGVTMSLARRLELLDWATRNKAWVVEDDYDGEYRYTGPPLASLQSLDHAGCVLYVGTLSKVLFPGLRLGYLVLPPGLVDAFVQARALNDRQAAIAPQVVLTDFINEGHFGRHIKRSRDAYAERRTALLDALAGDLGEYLVPGPADVGLQLSARFKSARDDQALVNAAAAQGLELRALSSFFTAAPSPTHGLVLGFAPFSPAQIRTGAESLLRLLHSSPGR